jgi:predicted nucleic acid-binding protein
MYKKRIYVETTVWYQMVNYSESEFKETAKQLFRLVEEDRYEIFISNIVLEEIGLNRTKYKKKLEKLLKEYKPHILVQNDEVEDIAAAYMENAYRGRNREDVYADAFHAAICCVANISYIVSYNYRHLLNVDAIEHLNAVNLLAGYNRFLSALPPFMFLNLEEYAGEKGTVDEKVWEIKRSLGEKYIELEKEKASKRRRYHKNHVKRNATRLELPVYELVQAETFTL